MVLTVAHVAKSYGSRSVLRDASLRAEPGQLVGVVGENGAGKTTLLRILSGDLRADAGTVRLDGTLGYCPQHPVLDEELTIRQHLRLFQIAHRLSRLDRADNLLQALGLAAYDQQPVKTLSGGTRQKLNLVLALMHDPEVLLLDEPYQGFDWDTYLRFWDIAHELRTAGRTVVIVSHLAYDTHRLDALYRLSDGRLHPVPTTEAQR
ncbi:ABC transporter ATP-binding protein [Streptomyces viridiviolaceus]|uniref:ABC transporter ATP-binding protein n=1 Tax=Streptomyces viridiviolaceus TaxID=68282 RepID=A0ABW2E3M2_9ACTN|nr:ABC transporter ATP-binding protein [Streptomyces viridiviolaceus]GHB72653.1 ABC transporter ATP-binding protein [Streptomyces viridiviolaceus]